VAVLPFLDLSPDGDQEYFCEGIAEEIINALAKVENLHIVARSSSFHFKGKGRDISRIAGDLGVNSVLDGSVRKSGDRLRIGTHLIDACDGFHIWSETYDRDGKDVFAVQDEIALAVVDALRVNLLGKEQAEVTKRHTADPDAYYLYLRGLWFINRRTREDFKKAIHYFEQAVAKDSRYALAYSGLADSYSMLPQYSTTRPRDVFPKARDAAARALEIDDVLAEAHASLGLIKVFYDWDWPGAEREYRRAIELGPRNAVAHHWYGFLLMSNGRFDEAKEQMEIARELDPLSLVINRNIGQVLYYARDYDAAMTALMRTLELDPNYSFASFCLGKAYLQNGMYGKALVEFERHRTMVSGWSPEGDAYVGIAHASMGDRKQAARILENMERQAEHEFAGPSPLAWLCLALDREEKALDLLEEAVDERDHEIVVLGVEPIYDRIRSDPRFTALLSRMGLVP
jgi:TolB-like protein/Tfp pilus assembly protein PilF